MWGAHFQAGHVGEGHSPDILLCLQRTCETGRVSGTSSTATKTFFPLLEMVLTLETISEIQWACRCYQSLLSSLRLFPCCWTIGWAHSVWSPWSELGAAKTQAARECSQAAAGPESCVGAPTQGEHPVGKKLRTLHAAHPDLMVCSHGELWEPVPAGGLMIQGGLPFSDTEPLASSWETGLVGKTITSQLLCILKIHPEMYYQALLWAGSSLRTQSDAGFCPFVWSQITDPRSDAHTIILQEHCLCRAVLVHFEITS